MPKYAETTAVPAERSRAEIERTLQRYGADGFMYGWEGRQATVIFRMQGRLIKFMLEMPDPNHFSRTPSGRFVRSRDRQHKAWEQATRQRWRALCLVIKAKLEAVEAGIAEFQEEFLAHIVLPDGRTVGQYMMPQIGAVYETGMMPRLLPATAEDL